MSKSELPIIGRAERVDFPDLGLFNIPAKTDTGADASSIWVSKVTETDEGIHCEFMGEGSEFYTGKSFTFTRGEYEFTRVANSFGQREVRYKVKLKIRIKGKLIRATFTLSDRGTKTYPILIGRKLLHGKFLVDVAAGVPLTEQENLKKKKLQEDLNEMGYSTK